MKYIQSIKLKKIINNLFINNGVNKNNATIITDNLILASLRGIDSHGIRLVPYYLDKIKCGRINIKPKFRFKKTSPSTCIIDANNSFGIPAGNFAIQQAIKMAKKTGIAAISVKNSSHFGMAAFYSLQAANVGMIGLSFTHSDSLVVPYGGKRPYLGTNPICFAAPIAGESPFCLDMATSSISWNKLTMHKNSKSKLEMGWAVDINGNNTTSANNATSLTHFGGYKGYGLSLMVEILSSLLSGMPFGPHINKMFPIDAKKRNLGHFFIVIDINKFVPLDEFKKRMKILINELRNTSPIKGNKKVMVAGDPEKIYYRERIKKGIPLDSKLIIELNKLATQFDLKEKL